MDQDNAEAGPSRISPHPQAPGPSSSPIFLPPPGPEASPVYLTSTQNLLATFHLSDAYNKHVRPFAGGPDASASGVDAKMVLPPTSVGSVDKGKGKEILGNGSFVSQIPQTPGADGQDPDDEDGGKGEKKWKNSYKHLIKDAPGRHSMKKDDYLTTTIQAPPKQPMKIVPFDQKTQREAFSVSLEGLKGWNANTLIVESPQAREDRKKRKELKRLHKAQQAAAAQASLPPIQTTSIQTPAPSHPSPSVLRSATPASTTSTRPPPLSTATPRPTGVTTPRPTIPRPQSNTGSRPPHPATPVQIPPSGARVATPVRIGTPSGPHPLSAPPLSASSLGFPGLPPTIANVPPTIPHDDKRGKKRERPEEMTNATYGNGVNGNGVALPAPTPVAPPAVTTVPKSIIGAKAGVAGVRPRPIKKQRVDIQGQARESVPIQQPTPQGV